MPFPATAKKSSQFNKGHSVPSLAQIFQNTLNPIYQMLHFLKLTLRLTSVHSFPGNCVIAGNNAFLLSLASCKYATRTVFILITLKEGRSVVL